MIPNWHDMSIVLILSLAHQANMEFKYAQYSDLTLIINMIRSTPLFHIFASYQSAYFSCVAADSLGVGLYTALAVNWLNVR